MGRLPVTISLLSIAAAIAIRPAPSAPVPMLATTPTWALYAPLIAKPAPPTATPTTPPATATVTSPTCESDADEPPADVQRLSRRSAGRRGAELADTDREHRQSG